MTEQLRAIGDVLVVAIHEVSAILTIHAYPVDTHRCPRPATACVRAKR